MGPNGELMAQCIENLPFSLTGDQQRALGGYSYRYGRRTTYAKVVAG